MGKSGNKLHRRVGAQTRLEEEKIRELSPDEALAASEHKYRTLIANANDAILVANTETGIILNANRRAGEPLGLKPSEIIGLHQTRLHPQEEADTYRAIFQDHIRKGEWGEEEMIVLHSSGRRVPVEFRASVIDLDGQTAIMGIFRDISTRKQAEEAQYAHLHYLEKMQRIISAVGKPPNPEEGLTNVISTIREVFGSDRAWLLYPCDPETKSWSVPVESTTQECPEAFQAGQPVPTESTTRQIFRDALNSDEPAVMEQMPEDKAFRRLSIRSQMTIAVQPRFGKPWLLGMHQCSHERTWSAEERHLFKDIAARIEDLLGSQHLHQELKKSEQATRQLIDSTGEGIYGVDADGNCTLANRACADLLGYKDASELIGKQMRQLTHHDCPGARSSTFIACRDCIVFQEGKNIFGADLLFQRADGLHFSAEFRCHPIYEEGVVTGAAASFTDITARRRAERVLQKAYDEL